MGNNLQNSSNEKCRNQRSVCEFDINIEYSKYKPFIESQLPTAKYHQRERIDLNKANF